MNFQLTLKYNAYCETTECYPKITGFLKNIERRALIGYNTFILNKSSIYMNIIS